MVWLYIIEMLYYSCNIINYVFIQFSIFTHKSARDNEKWNFIVLYKIDFHVKIVCFKLKFLVSIQNVMKGTGI